MALREIIDSAISDSRNQRVGSIASPFYKIYDIAGNWVWGCDIYLGGDKYMKGVPVAGNNRDIIYAEQGKGVSITRMNRGLWAISGLSKVCTESVHYIYVTFGEDLYEIDHDELVGFITRTLTFGELGDLVPPYGFGVLPFGTQGRFTLSGDFIAIMNWS